MPGRCQDGVFDGDQGLELADAAGQAPVAGAQEGGVLGAVGCHRGNTEGAGEPVVAVSGVCGFVSFTGLVESRGDPGPGGEVPGGGEATHVCSGFGDDYFGDVSSDTRASRRSRCIRHRNAWCCPKRPTSAWVSALILVRIRPLAIWARTCGSRSPAISASSIARPDTPRMSVATEEILIPASSSSFSSRAASRVCSRDNVVR